MTPELEQRIRTRAYEIWEREGRPDGREHEQWLAACREIEGEAGAPQPAKQASPRSAAAGSAKRASNTASA